VLLNTIRQVLDQKPCPDEILVIDQTPKHEEETCKTLSRWHACGDIRWILQTESSLTQARNRAVLETDAEIIAFLDDDALIKDDWLASHTRHYAIPEVSAVVGQLYWRIDDFSQLDPYHPTRGTVVSFNTVGVRRVDFLVGCNFSVRREHLIRARGFDQAFKGAANYEEGDFAYRLIKSGGVILLDSDAYIIHLQYPSGGCRSSGHPNFVGWTKSYNYFLYTFRHLKGKKQFLKVFNQAMRIPFSGTHRSPGRWPECFLTLVRAFTKALIQASRPPQSPWSTKTMSFNQTSVRAKKN